MDLISGVLARISRFEGIPEARFMDDSDTAIWVPEQERITRDGSAIGNNTTLVFMGCYIIVTVFCPGTAVAHARYLQPDDARSPRLHFILRLPENCMCWPTSIFKPPMSRFETRQV